MRGLEISKLFFEEIGRPALEAEFPSVFRHMAFGLVGEGSECWGFDDEISRDHDWGAGFCIWMPEPLCRTCGAAVQKVYRALPDGGYPRRVISAYGDSRTGVIPIREFYFRFLGTASRPSRLTDWLAIPEEGLSAVTNGEVFLDERGEFSALRKEFLEYYPEDVRLKKLAAKTAKAAQSGQYNYQRCRRRAAVVPAELAKAEFCSAAMSVVFLLNRRYAPYYKWTCRALESLPILPELAGQFEELMNPVQLQGNSAERIEQISAQIIAELRRQNLTDSRSDFLLDHSQSIVSQISDPELRKLHFAADFL